MQGLLPPQRLLLQEAMRNLMTTLNSVPHSAESKNLRNLRISFGTTCSAGVARRSSLNLPAPPSETRRGAASGRKHTLICFPPLIL